MIDETEPCTETLLKDHMPFNLSKDMIYSSTHVSDPLTLKTFSYRAANKAMVNRFHN